MVRLLYGTSSPLLVVLVAALAVALALVPEAGPLLYGAAAAAFGAASGSTSSSWKASATEPRVAVVGGGIAGLSAAQAFQIGGARPTVLEALGRAGGHSTTVRFPTSDGKYYPVDVGYAYNPTMDEYEPLRMFERHNKINLRGPLVQRVDVYRAGFEAVTDAEEAALDAECDSFMRVVTWAQAHPLLSKALLAPLSLRQLLRLLGLSDDFFLLRLYPVIRFVIVSGSKGAMLDATSLGGLTTFTTGWGNCYRDKLHGNHEWYSVAGGAESHLSVLEEQLGEAVRVSATVRSVEPDADGVTVQWDAPDGSTHSERFDAVVMATAPDDSAAILGPHAPAWTRLPTTEEITVVVHSDDSFFPPQDGMMVYACAHGNSAESGEYASASLSVRWDTMHGDRVEPRPILTYHPESIKGNATLRGEVFRRTFKHIHLPGLLEYLRVTAGIHAARLAPGGRVFFAGAWSKEYAMSHPAGLVSGWDAAEAVLGKKPDTTGTFWDARHRDQPGWESRLRENSGRWE